MDRLEIVKGLKCLNIVESWPDKREFYVQGASASEYRRIVAEAVAALTPRVLALEEIPKWDGAVYIEERAYGTCIMALYSAERLPSMIFLSQGGHGALAQAEYGRYWRCWTMRPTPHEMALEPWTVAEDEA